MSTATLAIDLLAGATGAAAAVTIISGYRRAMDTRHRIRRQLGEIRVYRFRIADNGFDLKN